MSVSEDIKLKSYKSDYLHSYTFGVFPTIEMLECRFCCAQKVLLSTDGCRNKGVQLIKEKCAKLRIPCIEDNKTIQRLSPKENCYAIGVFSKFSESLNKSTNHIILVNPSDKGNLGTIMRTAVAFGIQDLGIITPGADVFDPKTVRASMGAIFRLNISLYSDFNVYKQAFSTENRNLYPFMLDGNPMDKLSSENIFSKGNPYTLIFGNESSGLSSEYLQLGTPIRIDHLNTVDSLNLTIAAGIGIQFFYSKEREYNGR